MDNINRINNDAAKSIGVMKNKVLDITITGILIALVVIATMFINIRLPMSINGGLIHLGNVPLIIAAIVFDKKKGAIAGAFGMGLFDLISGWALWAPFTFIIRGIMGFIIGYIAEKRDGKNIGLNIIAIVAGGIWMIFGYYVSEVILYGNFLAPLTSIPGDAIQMLAALVLTVPLINKLKSIKEKMERS